MDVQRVITTLSKKKGIEVDWTPEKVQAMTIGDINQLARDLRIPKMIVLALALDEADVADEKKEAFRLVEPILHKLADIVISGMSDPDDAVEG
jgi:hypothetical protein